MAAKIESEDIPPFGGLFSRIAIATIIIMATVLAIMTAVFSSYLDRMSAQQAEDRLSRSIAVLSPIIDGAVGKGDVQTARQILLNLVEEDGVICVDYIAAKNNLSSTQTVIRLPMDGCASFTDPDIKIIEVGIRSSSAGNYRFLIDKDFFADDRNEQLFQTILIIVIVLVMVIVMLAAVFNWLVLRPLQNLQGAMIESRPSKPALATIFRKDEIGAVSRTYNKLAAASRIYFARLEKSQNNLRQSETKFKDMAEISGDWFYEMDQELRFTYISDRFFELTGFERERFIGKTRVEISGEKSNDRDWQSHLADLNARQPFKNFEYALHIGQEAPMILRINGKPLYNSDDEFIGYRGTGTDVTDITRDRKLLEETNRNFGDSVSYASTIQRGLLPKSEQLETLFGRAAVMWQPKDVVGGDFYWLGQISGARYLVFFDCTGHGVPGAFMTLITTSVLEKIVAASPFALPAPQMLEQIHKGVCESLGITKDQQGKDGLDCAVIKMLPSEGMLEFAGASIDLMVISDSGEVTRLRGARHALGYQQHETARDFPKYDCMLAGNSFVLTSDGLTTQVGEATKRVLGTRRVIEALEAVEDNTPPRLLRALGLLLKRWQGSEERRDDVSILAFRPYD